MSEMKKWVVYHIGFFFGKFKNTLQMIGPRKNISWHMSTTTKKGSKNLSTREL